METLSKASWDAIPEDYKAIEPNGRRVVMRKTDDGVTTFVTVQVEDDAPRRRRNDRAATRSLSR